MSSDRLPSPRKRFGQHFLEPAWVAKVLRAIDPQPHDVFIEIGPGRGALTRPLAEGSKAVVAFEIDRDLAADLRQTAPPNVTIVEGDFLESAATLERYRGTPLRAAGNLPYNIASPILFKLVELFSSGLTVGDATVMLQREVADRLVARPGRREYGVLSIHMQHTADVERLLTLPPGAFRPPPKVHSALVRLRFHQPSPAPRDPATFAALVQAIFTRRRKTLANALLAYPEKGGRVSFPEALREAGIDGTRRPEALTARELVRLADAVARLPEKS